MRVHGIDLSTDMVARLKAKPGAEEIEVTDRRPSATTTAVEGKFGLAYLVYNTIENLTEQDDQVECFCNVARHLNDGGHFVVEVEIPPLRRLPPGQTALPFRVTPSRLGFDELETANQRGVSHHYWVADGTFEVFAMPYRYVWPSELDLMARLAGMQLRERWGSWTRDPFTSDSSRHTFPCGRRPVLVSPSLSAYPLEWVRPKEDAVGTLPCRRPTCEDRDLKAIKTPTSPRQNDANAAR